ncbi:uncharacterized protein LOC115210245 [Octopus sinensis]|uniref:Uncharacterized protein LOC115210245 n=1 Tax=Octopus sinensis TaxID=2607531 RepID=A0A6P7S924_9MOLL|nr:uncharacterized protein LOC115210245 [Octopus sinensis]
MNSIRVVFFVAFVMSMLFAVRVVALCAETCPPVPDDCPIVQARCANCIACALGDEDNCNSASESCLENLVCANEVNEYFEGLVPDWAIRFVGKCTTKNDSMVEAGQFSSSYESTR